MALFLKISEGDEFYIGDSDAVFTRFDSGEAEMDINDGGRRHIVPMRPCGRPYWFSNGCRMELKDYLDGVAKFRFDAPKEIKIDRSNYEGDKEG